MVFASFRNLPFQQVYNNKVSCYTYCMAFAWVTDLKYILGYHALIACTKAIVRARTVSFISKTKAGMASYFISFLPTDPTSFPCSVPLNRELFGVALMDDYNWWFAWIGCDLILFLLLCLPLRIHSEKWYELEDNLGWRRCHLALRTIAWPRYHDVLAMSLLVHLPHIYSCCSALLFVDGNFQTAESTMKITRHTVSICMYRLPKDFWHLVSSYVHTLW